LREILVAGWLIYGKNLLILTTDRVHLADMGNRLVAEKMLDVILATE
jgi:hypothetical protein